MDKPDVHHDILLSDQPLSLDQCRDFVAHPSCGGLCFFVGTIRDLNLGETVTHLEFEAYAPMAIKEMRKIAVAAREKFGLHAVALYHRTGDLAIGDVAVIVAVSSVHRKPAFEGCEFVIDELKKHVPIWKKEFRPDGSHWLNARP
ncbi:molybdopterin synthase subunit MoaE [Neolewinella xylanilytica]|uniref:Molybdopterin synthase catalytic subunit n=1 Tax=Neolewinella xylanilytica TaxID=1514080 RepID=A0A2S6I4V5_9BACT|nr:molybdenum cofactor biosynthesis protein MoaE [Neolewinella xylanilytica]PPK86131.1 molybdopterin synthase subunit MoaE [Neolewinella xylanilytica]